MSDEPLYVTRPALPPLSDYQALLADIWSSGRLTNGGPFHARLEAALAEYLDVPYVSLFANGTLALLVALRALKVEGEVVTTPFSFVATAHALLWSGCRPVFADIDPVTLNLDPAAARQALTPHTRALLPVHVYGRPCALSAFQSLATERDLALIYDAAHAFGVRLETDNLLRQGDLSVLSFHATKIFHTFEGGAIVCHDPAMKAHIDLLKNFGFKGETRVIELGINAKMNELQAAFGLRLLADMDTHMAGRAASAARYRAGLAGLPGLRCLEDLPGVARPNHAYFPVLVEDGFPLSREELYLFLRSREIYGRRYFYPLISDFPMYREMAADSPLPVARRVAERVLCLPMFSGMESSQVDRVVDAILEACRR